MRLSTVLLQGCALLQCAAAKDGYLYTFNDERRIPSTNANSISADTAFAIASRRQGATDGISLDGLDEQALIQISEHGGYRQPLFSEATSTGLPRVFVRIQTTKPETSQGVDTHATFRIEQPTKDLSSMEPQNCQGHNITFRLSSKEGVRLAGRIYHEVRRSFTYMFQLTSPLKSEILSEKDQIFSSGRPIAEILDLFRTYLSNTIDLVSANIDVDFTHSKVSQSAVTSQINHFIDFFYSSVAISSHQPTLLILPSTSQLATSTASLIKRQDLEEEPLDLTLPSIPDLFSDSPSSYRKNTTLPRRFPSCFSSKEACRNATNDCSGHGSCAASGSNEKCFKCKCGRTTIRTNKDGSKKTNLWAGAACQKKDVSTEFTLFAVFGVTMAMLIMGVIGMMYSMGVQELPSVIGAGVAGPSARK